MAARFSLGTLAPAIAVCVSASAAAQSPPATAPPATTARVMEVARDPEQRMAFESFTILTPPPTGLIHHSLDKIALPPEGIDVPLTCVVALKSGTINSCRRQGAQWTTMPMFFALDTPLEAAVMRAMWIRLRPDPNPQIPRALTDIVIRLQPSDRVKTGEPANVRQTADVDWRRGPPADFQLLNTFSLNSLSEKVTLTTTCQIQQDLSFVCTKAKYDPKGVKYVEEQPPFLLAMMMTSGPALKDGTPAAGAWVDVPMVLEPTPVAIAPLRN